MYDGMLVYADLDKTQCELKIAMDHGKWVNREMDNNMVFLEGKMPHKDKLKSFVDNNMKELFEQIINERYFLILNQEWTKELQSEEYIEQLKESRQKKK